MYTICKYPLILTDEQIIKIPMPATILSVIEQDDIDKFKKKDKNMYYLAIYALVDTENKDKQSVKFTTVMEKDNSVDHVIGMKFLGTIKMNKIMNNTYIWHVFYSYV